MVNRSLKVLSVRKGSYAWKIKELDCRCKMLNMDTTLTINYQYTFEQIIWSIFRKLTPMQLSSHLLSYFRGNLSKQEDSGTLKFNTWALAVEYIRTRTTRRIVKWLIARRRRLTVDIHGIFDPLKLVFGGIFTKWFHEISKLLCGYKSIFVLVKMSESLEILCMKTIFKAKIRFTLLEQSI